MYRNNISAARGSQVPDLMWIALDLATMMPSPHSFSKKKGTSSSGSRSCVLNLACFPQLSIVDLADVCSRQTWRCQINRRTWFLAYPWPPRPFPRWMNCVNRVSTALLGWWVRTVPFLTRTSHNQKMLCELSSGQMLSWPVKDCSAWRMGSPKLPGSELPSIFGANAPRQCRETAQVPWPVTDNLLWNCLAIRDGRQVDSVGFTAFLDMGPYDW